MSTEWSQDARLIAALNPGDAIISESWNDATGALTVLVKRASDGAVTEEVRNPSELPPIMSPKAFTQALLKQTLIEGFKRAHKRS